MLAWTMHLVGDVMEWQKYILQRFVFLRSKIFRTNAPFDGKDVFEIEYRGNIFTYYIVDYIRKVQDDLYLGVATLRQVEKQPIVFFMLEKVN
ncbi:hypothetical protein Bhyg_10179 [Pseudolycoriella hygida]|uniref:Uncharacterized protein n=1 Tax=Pseudolycoriella hygida TaxID=35572 RepID=A0A9Q0MUR4_9DIPT|nr:hypothetical protein Bhyg_10179 [Pseudolycoriella hygida]